MPHSRMKWRGRGGRSRRTKTPRPCISTRCSSPTRMDTRSMRSRTSRGRLVAVVTTSNTGTIGEWVGFGCGAHSTRGGCRWRNVSETDAYVAKIVAGEPVVAQRHVMSDRERIGDMLFTGLRLSEGLDLEEIQREYGVSVMQDYGKPLAPFLDAAFLIHDRERLYLTREGMLLANDVMQTFV